MTATQETLALFLALLLDVLPDDFGQVISGSVPQFTHLSNGDNGTALPCKTLCDRLMKDAT